MTRDEIVRAIRAERRRTLALVRRLEPDQFEVMATPGWRVREVLAHLITTDRATVLGSNLAVLLASAERLERWNDRQVRKWADRPISDLLLGLDRWGRRLARIRLIPSPLYRLRLPTFLGRAPVELLAWSRVYDEWVHRQDIRRALGMPDEDVDVAPVAEFILAAIEVNTVPQLKGRPGTLSISLKDAPIAAWRYDLGSGRSGPEGTDHPVSAPSDVRISANAPAFVMAAAGRDSFRDLADRGDLTVEGDEGLAEAFLGVLRIV